MPDAASHQERNSCAAKSGERSGESERAGAAFRGILLGQPERIDGEVGAAETQKEQANEKPWERARSKVEDLAERERDEHHHQSEEEGERSAPTEPLRQPRHGQAAENRGKRNQHHSPGGDLRGSWPDVATGLSQRRNGGGNVYRSGPQAADGSQHQ